MNTGEPMLVETTRKGFPAAWECGGGATNTGQAEVFALPNGGRPWAIYIARRGHLASGAHALIPLHEGMIRVTADHHRRDFDISVERIISLDQNAGGGWEATVETVCTLTRGEWDTTLPESLDPAVEAAKNKATCYHCREPHYISNRE